MEEFYPVVIEIKDPEDRESTVRGNFLDVSDYEVPVSLKGTMIFQLNILLKVGSFGMKR